MKHKSFMVVCLVLLLGTALAAFGQDATVNLESKVIESFNSTEDGLYVWRKDASRFAVGKDPADKDNPSFANFGLEGGDFYPKLSFFDVWPMALYRNNREGKEIKSLGVWGKFKRMGYNWIDIYPTLKSQGDDAEPYEIPLPGHIRFLDVWAWGSNLNYYIEAYIRDEQGVIHTLYLGSLSFQGWKNLRIAIPTAIPQRRRIILDPTSASMLSTAEKNSIYLKFVKFRIWTTPREEVANFYTYLHQLRVMTDVYERIFDGDEMSDPDWIRENWETGSGN
ncbi:MAG: flagellar filament outer layer protein FlaA [Treponema sp.]|nr:flagellar filament outer layer protein FlaA [Treponema sp.]